MQFNAGGGLARCRGRLLNASIQEGNAQVPHWQWGTIVSKWFTTLEHILNEGLKQIGNNDLVAYNFCSWLLVSQIIDGLVWTTNESPSMSCKHNILPDANVYTNVFLWWFHALLRPQGFAIVAGALMCAVWLVTILWLSEMLSIQGNSKPQSWTQETKEVSTWYFLWVSNFDTSYLSSV